MFGSWLLAESGFAHVRRALFGNLPNIRTIGIITAENPQGQEQTPAINNELNRQLEDVLRAGNLGPIKGNGSFFGIREKPFLVPNISRDYLLQLGKYYNQESVIWGQKQVDADNNPFFRFEYIKCENGETTQFRTVHVGNEDVQKRPDMYTMIKGRKFIIPFFKDKYEKYIPGPKYGTIVPQPTDGGEKIETFFIPFFDAPLETTTFGKPNQLSYYLEEVNQDAAVIAQIREHESKILESSRTGKSHWHHRGMMWLRLETLLKDGID